ncbi:hypothetical protein NOF55_01980 [Rhizobiaceae bacterium BDR2-2]|uniref:Uncharacterized protein n=1 Tax=Ectorhizobium quercum TaxID=2965071 RepID=A0AAE3MVY0_9HYPH|nr:hypothetical protein [Ectorhizobium quercum]MCX8995869.1 hypothetical protein [Ectorhizobium quercum]
MAILEYAYIIIAIIFLTANFFEGRRRRLPLMDRLIGFGLCLLWPIPLCVVAFSELRSLKPSRSDT